MRPTDDTYSELQQAYDHFNAELFDGQLSGCLITLQREKKTYGYFSAQRFVRREDGVKTDEIAMNPAYFAVCPVLEVMQTLVHEMVHAWQQHFGKPGRRRYHNKEWADKMEAVGLMPSSTGKPGGKKTGESVADYPIEGGPFMTACDKLLKDFKLSWMDRFPARHVTAQALLEAAGEGMSADLDGLGVSLEESAQSKPTRTKYTCLSCETNVWGKPALKLVCGECGSHYEANASQKESQADRSIALQ
jgi:predicted SprT family Zn-dependent metalloprotease